MNCYEHTLILKQDLPASQNKKIIDKYENLIKDPYTEFRKIIIYYSTMTVNIFGDNGTILPWVRNASVIKRVKKTKGKLGNYI